MLVPRIVALGTEAVKERGRRQEAGDTKPEAG
jgi:hypothetical protein